MANEFVNLQLNNFDNKIGNNWRNLRDDVDLCDVTLATDDNQLTAHKVILSSCSEVLKNLFKKNPHQHPLIYMRGVTFDQLKNVINFMYQGQVNISLGDLDDFLVVAKDLQVEGLTEDKEQSEAIHEVRREGLLLDNSEVNKRIKPIINENDAIKRKDNFSNLKRPVQYTHESKEAVIEENKTIDKANDAIKRKDNFNPTIKFEHFSPDEFGYYTVDDSMESLPVDGEIIDKANVMKIQSKEKLYSCKNCPSTFTMKHNLKRHVQYTHESKEAVLEENKTMDMKSHIQYTYESKDAVLEENKTMDAEKDTEKKYSCDQCPSKFTMKMNAKRHVDYAHTGIKHGCDKCSYQASTKANLKRHILSMHPVPVVESNITFDQAKESNTFDQVVESNITFDQANDFYMEQDIYQ